MLPDNRFDLEVAARGLRRRWLTERRTSTRGTRFDPPDWPRSRGPTPNPCHP